MSRYAEIARMAGQVRSEMRVVEARGGMAVPPEMVNGRLGQLEESIRMFKFRIPFERRREKEVQGLIRDLHRLHDDLLLFMSRMPVNGVDEENVEEMMVLYPVSLLSSLLFERMH